MIILCCFKTVKKDSVWWALSSMLVTFVGATEHFSGETIMYQGLVNIDLISFNWKKGE